MNSLAQVQGSWAGVSTRPGRPNWLLRELVCSRPYADGTLTHYPLENRKVYESGGFSVEMDINDPRSILDLWAEQRDERERDEIARLFTGLPESMLK